MNPRAVPPAATDPQASALSDASGAQSSVGMTVFSGVKTGDQLPLRLDFGGSCDSFDRYILRIPAQKMTSAASQFKISYPNYYHGAFDAKAIELIVKGKVVPAHSSWDAQARSIEIVPTDPVAPGSPAQIVLSNVKNPAFAGIFYFTCEVLPPGGVPPLQYLGTWIVSIQ